MARIQAPPKRAKPLFSRKLIPFLEPPVSPAELNRSSLIRLSKLHKQSPTTRTTSTSSSIWETLRVISPIPWDLASLNFPSRHIATSLRFISCTVTEAATLRRGIVFKHGLELGPMLPSRRKYDRRSRVYPINSVPDRRYLTTWTYQLGAEILVPRGRQEY
jgi:hypothetical protein